MGPISRAAVIKAQEADTRFKSAVLDELQGIRAALNTLTGRTALEAESINERIDRIEERLTARERA
jgi:hypothetical protein